MNSRPNDWSDPFRAHVQAAQGWFDLGLPLEADKELDEIEPELRTHPDVLALRWDIYAHAERWDACVDIGEALVKIDPEFAFGWLRRSFALHKLNRTTEAAELLLPSLDRFPRNWLIRYNLACYACRLGDSKATWNWLDQAFKVGDADDIKSKALEDPDLERFWNEIGKL